MLRLVLLFSFAIQIACGSSEFKGANNGTIGRTVPRVEPVNLFEDPATNPNKNPGPTPGIGVDPQTGKVPGNGKIPVITKQSFMMNCQSVANMSVDYTRSVNDRVESVVRGQICPETRNQLHVIFLVDYSGSMGPHYDSDTKTTSSGNDPLVNGSCGRLDAANALITKMLNERQDSTKQEIVVSMIPFANQVINSRKIDAMAIDTFAKRELNASRFCRYVAQEGYERRGESLSSLEMGFGSDVDPSTNYEAAFDDARTTLAANSAKYDASQVFFITDGEPTTPGDRTQALAAAEAAGLKLRNDRSVKNTTINGLYLGQPGSDVYKRAADVLAKITGSKERVVPVASAAKLAEKILAFPKAKINLDETKYGSMASLNVSPYPEKVIGIRYLREVSDGVWEYETQPFFLHGIKGQTIPNVVKIDIVGEDGFLFKSSLTINYTQN